MVLVGVARIFFQALFFQTLILAWRGHFEELQLNNDLADFNQIWPDSRKYIINENLSGNSIILKILLLENHFRAFTPHGFLAV